MMQPTLSCNNCGTTNQAQAAYCRSCGHSLQTVQSTIYHSATGRLLTNSMLKQRYRIIVPIGKGGMGAVYQAEDTQLGNRKVALKEMSQSGLSPQEQQEAADAFRQEAIILARLQHRSLPSIFDHFEENGRWYLIMSFIEGETLANYLSRTRNGKLPLDEVLQIGMQLCTVLGYLHAQHPAIIFRDLKPSNIMRGSDGHIYLIDFGIARHFKPGQAKDTAYYGSMGYAPPEQYGRAQTTPRSDIYSLGAVLYQLLSGHNPSTTPFQLPSLRSQVPTTPIELTTLITQTLELDESKRPTSVQIVNQKLQSLATTSRATPPVQPPVATSTPTFFGTVPASTNPKQGDRRFTWLVGMLVAIVMVGGLVYFASYRAPLGSNPNQTLPTTGSTPAATPNTSPITTQIPVLVTEIWNGRFQEADGSTSQVSLSLDGGSTAASFSGKWTNFVGVVSVKGYVTFYNSLAINVQKDLNNIGGNISSRIIYWLGQGDAKGNIWPNASYYCILSGIQMQCIAYAGEASPLNFNLSLNGTKSIFIA